MGEWVKAHMSETVIGDHSLSLSVCAHTKGIDSVVITECVVTESTVSSARDKLKPEPGIPGTIVDKGADVRASAWQYRSGHHPELLHHCAH
ncbi:hypothetical protein KB1_14200 [Cutibacterium modestum]|uniref:Uncharacterized protein n=1 Tax=Cutibacterium modestum TaxID=2559073 RepID=A0AAD1NVS0_9ACTN|nr:hypothetical protein KB1_14200 [Cutibacterium modestum]